MNYFSTRGKETVVNSAQAIVNGIAKDGGLYVPAEFPKLSKTLDQIIELEYKEIAEEVLYSFFNDFDREQLKDSIDKAYGRFSNKEVAPLVKKGDAFYIELFHGPTFAFKDVALMLLPHLMINGSKIVGEDKEIVILTATSGDTGKAALEGFTDVKGTKIIVFYPQQGVSEVQKLQMVTQKGENVLVVGIDGNFDDAQRSVKEIFADKALNEKMNANDLTFSSANSINIGRLVPQVVYYFSSYAKLVKDNEINLGDSINVVVPSGNFGNILAAYYAKKLGLPINKFICASNKNKVLSDFFKDGVYDRNRDMHLTISPSMDILVSSNLERYLFEISGQDTEITKTLMNDLNTKGVYTVNEEMKEKLKSFYGGYCDDESTLAAIKEVYEKYNYVIDTHTAVAYHVYEQYKKETGDTTKTVIASTASPFKFAQSVCEALGSFDEKLEEYAYVKELAKIAKVEVPELLAELEHSEIKHTTKCGKAELKDIVVNFLKLGK